MKTCFFGYVLLMERDSFPLEGLDLNLLPTLRALLRQSSVSRAAELLGQTQPTVSRSLAKLRAAFDDPILVRSGRGMALTPMGQALRAPLERSLAAIERLRSSGDFNPETARRKFRIILPDIVGQLLIPEFLVRTQKSCGVSFQIFGSEKDSMRSLLADDVDLVLGVPVLDHPDLRVRNFNKSAMPMTVLYGPRHAAWEAGMTFELWRDSFHVQLIPGGRPARLGPIDRILKERGESRKIRMHLSHLAALGPTIYRTPYVSALPEPFAKEIAARHGLRTVPHPLRDALEPTVLRLSWHRLHHDDVGHRWLRSQLGQLIEELRD